MQWRRSGGLLCLFVALSAAAEEDLSQLSLEQLSDIKVSSSTLFVDTIANAPSSVTVFSQEDIRRMGAERLLQLVNFVPGFQSYHSDSSSAGHAISSRSYTVGDYCPEILVLLNGHRINSDKNGGVVSSNIDLWLDNVERVEFIRGPGSAIYGSNAMLGVINITTARNKEIKVSSGSFGEQHASGQWTIGEENKHLNLYVRNEKREGESLTIYDPISRADRQTRDPYKDSELMLNGKLGDFSAQTRWSDLQNKDFYVAGVGLSDRNLLESQTAYLDLGHHWNPGNHLSLESHLNRSVTETSGESANSATTYLYAEAYLRGVEHGFSQTMRFENETDRALVGWELRRAWLTDSQTLVHGVVERSFEVVPKNVRNIRGLFSEWQHQLTQNSSLLLAARHDDYSGVGSHLSPRAAFIYGLTESDTLKLMYAEAFRVPTRSELGVKNNLLFAGNSNLKPETTKITELAWVHSKSEQLYTATIYHATLLNAIERVSTTPKSWDNMPSAEWSGLEFEWQFRHANWLFRAAASSVFESDLEHNNQAEDLFSLLLSYKGNHWDAALTSHFQGSQYQAFSAEGGTANLGENDYRYLGGKAIYGAQFNYQWQPQLTLYLHADNLFNRQYYAPADNASENLVGVPQTGRALMAGFVWML